LIHPDAPDPSLTLEALRQVINSALQRHTFSYDRRHALQRSLERDVTVDDIVHVCMTGRFKRDPRYEYQNWKYEVIGIDLDDEELTVIIAVDNEKYRVTVVTIF
jgi:hypothetical protein